ncbi:MAG: hypothetical protein GYB55_00030 [Cytophagales bacterium]|uniref:hypothetical protein n=1 Tax=Cyclobacterium marinum TaxID=104 RepID=UPI0030D71A4F|nr:hypothetical protein [Cytophagales bacterium]|tara:strand:+ start:59714 stop:61339 length:1626 start_codon:yes stop_codon:yes gene_type:complete
MTFSEIVKELNRRIKESDSILLNLQSERSEKKGLKRVSSKFFNDREDILNQGYTFHYGGGDEFQFNIGKEPEYEGEPVFRFGLAFNFQASQSVPDPIGVQQNQIQRFNQLLLDYTSDLSEERFWVWNGSGRTKSTAVGKIFKYHQALGNFLFIGKSIAKELKDITKEDLELIIDEFEYLYPVYQYVQLEMDQAIKLDKVARICFNTEGWVKPSGPVGKSKNQDTHEANHGFGHEEWLFDFSKLINGYHFGFLEPIYKYPDTYVGKVFNVNLITIDSGSKKRYWVGEIQNLEVIGLQENKRIKKEYQKRGWYREMEDQLKAFELDPLLLGEWTGNEWLFNVKFKPEDCKIDNLIEVDPYDKAISSTRYTLINLNKLPSEIEDREGAHGLFGPPLKSDSKPSFAKTSVRTSGPRITEIPHLHYKITESLYQFLDKKGYTVEYERLSPAGGKVDMIGWKGTKATFFEIKTYPNAKACIREALGQILEYSLYPAENRAFKLVIVSHNKSIDLDQKYIKHLRESLNLNLEYWGFDHEKNEVFEIIK